MLHKLGLGASEKGVPFFFCSLGFVKHQLVLYISSVGKECMGMFCRKY